jgi:hypothetical protein
MPNAMAFPRPARLPGHARRHQRFGGLDARWRPACQCGWTFYTTVRTLRVADRTYGFHLDHVYSEASSATGPR